MGKVMRGLFPMTGVRTGQYDRGYQIGQYHEEGDRSPL